MRRSNHTKKSFGTGWTAWDGRWTDPYSLKRYQGPKRHALVATGAERLHQRNQGDPCEVTDGREGLPDGVSPPGCARRLFRSIRQGRVSGLDGARKSFSKLAKVVLTMLCKTCMRMKRCEQSAHIVDI